MAHNLLLQLRLILVFGLPAAISIAPAARTRELVIDSCELFDLLKSSAHARSKPLRWASGHMSLWRLPTSTAMACLI